MNVLVACEESQTVCTAFREKGHNCFSCDLLPCSGGHPEWHIKGDVLNYLNPCFFESDLSFGIGFTTMDNRPHFIKGKWDLIIAHPPCTFISKAGACRMYPTAGIIDQSRYSKALLAKAFFLQCLNANCDRICVENPVPLKCIGLPVFTQSIQPYYFGEPFSKQTFLWLKGLPTLKPTNICSSWRPYLPSNTSCNSGTPYNRGSASGSRKRSKTFLGIALAMAEQWGGVL